MAQAEVLADALRELGLKIDKVHYKPSVEGATFTSSYPYVNVTVYPHGDVLVSALERKMLSHLQDALEVIGYKTTSIYMDPDAGMPSFSAE